MCVSGFPTYPNFPSDPNVFIGIFQKKMKCNLPYLPACVIGFVTFAVIAVYTLVLIEVHSMKL